MSNLSIKLKVVTPEKTVFEDEIYQVTLPTGAGEITILPNHYSYISNLVPGELCVKLISSREKEKKEMCFFYISGGFIEFHDNELIILADAAERAEEIDLKLAEEARKKAEELKKQKVSMDDAEFAKVAVAIQQESARIRVAKKHRTRHGIKIN